MADELDRALRQRDLALMAEPRSRGVAPRKPGILDIGNGVTERLAFLNQTFNPVEGIGSAMRAGSRMLAPDQSYWDRIASLGEMVSGVASIAAPIAAAKAIGVPAASAMMEGLLGASPTSQAATDMARQFGVDESGALRLFHGSPHDFDRFSMSKIGTGEGVQAYGPGLYFAENEGIARSYRDALARPYYVADDGVNVAEKYGADVVDAFENVGGDPAEITATINRLQSAVQRNLAEFGVRNVSELQPEYTGDLASSTIDMARRAEGLNALLKSADVRRVNEGRMYEVNVNANPEDFLDWDRPLSEQPQVVRDFANARWQQIYGRDPDPSIEGEYIAKMASPQFGIDSPDWLLRGGPGDAQRELLREAGIPGIRYLDQGSRSFTPTTIKDTPSGSELYWGNDPNPIDVFPTRQAAEEAAKQFDTRSRNYVVFDENLINIVRKYGIAGAATMLGVSALDVEQAMAENMSPSQWDQLVVGPQ